MKNSMANFLRLAAVSAFVSSFVSGSVQQRHVDSFGEVVSFVNQYSRLLVLSDDRSGAPIAVLPAMQGRVLTSSAAARSGQSFGWINRDLIRSGKDQQHFNAVGGEDRIWVGPEGGQFSVFFAPGAPSDLDHWYTPAPLDTEPFDIVNQTKTSVSFRKAFRLTNHSGTKFEAQFDREVRLLSDSVVWEDLRVSALKDVKVVGFESENKLTVLAGTS